jgi:hypothetical protein
MAGLRLTLQQALIQSPFLTSLVIHRLSRPSSANSTASQNHQNVGTDQNLGRTKGPDFQLLRLLVAQFEVLKVLAAPWVVLMLQVARRRVQFGLMVGTRVGCCQAELGLSSDLVGVVVEAGFGVPSFRKLHLPTT